LAIEDGADAGENGPHALHTPGGSPDASAISTSRRAVSGENSAGLWTTVQPAASAGAIFQVDSMNGVFHA
jgi:hypothetical protein